MPCPRPASTLPGLRPDILRRERENLTDYIEIAKAVLRSAGPPELAQAHAAIVMAEQLKRIADALEAEFKLKPDTQQQ
jgi:hypothetical protein